MLNLLGREEAAEISVGSIAFDGVVVTRQQSSVVKQSRGVSSNCGIRHTNSCVDVGVDADCVVGTDAIFQVHFRRNSSIDRKRSQKARAGISRRCRVFRRHASIRAGMNSVNSIFDPAIFQHGSGNVAIA